MGKERFSISIDEDIIKTISSLSNQTGLSKSFIVNKWILNGLKDDYRLSSTERYFFSKRIIMNSIEGLLRSLGYDSCNLDISTNLIILYSIPSVCFKTEKEFNLFRLSIFEIIDKIHTHDTKLHEDIIDSLKELNLKVLKNSEISEFPKSSETSRNEKRYEATELCDNRYRENLQEIDNGKSRESNIEPPDSDKCMRESSLLPARGTDITIDTIPVTGLGKGQK